jgi:hypothetical protein
MLTSGPLGPVSVIHAHSGPHHTWAGVHTCNIVKQGDKARGLPLRAYKPSALPHKWRRECSSLMMNEPLSITELSLLERPSGGQAVVQRCPLGWWLHRGSGTSRDVMGGWFSPLRRVSMLSPPTLSAPREGLHESLPLSSCSHSPPMSAGGLFAASGWLLLC